MSADLQAKYNALLRKFIGDHIFVDHATDVEVAKDIAATMQEKARRNAEVARISNEAQINACNTYGNDNYFESAQ